MFMQGIPNVLFPIDVMVRDGPLAAPIQQDLSDP